jgi:hypothetical protein
MRAPDEDIEGSGISSAPIRCLGTDLGQPICMRGLEFTCTFFEVDLSNPDLKRSHMGGPDHPGFHSNHLPLAQKRVPDEDEDMKGSGIRSARIRCLGTDLG